jgi:hypothetical protein
VYQYSRGDYVSFDMDVKDIDWDTTLNCKSIHRNWERFKEIYKTLRDKHVPSKMLKPGSIKPAWLRDKRLLKGRKKKKKMKKQYNNTKLHVDKMKLEEACTQYNHEIEQAKRRHEQSIASNIHKNPRRFYSYAKNYTKPNSSIECLIVNNKKITNEKETADVLNNK